VGVGSILYIIAKRYRYRKYIVGTRQGRRRVYYDVEVYNIVTISNYSCARYTYRCQPHWSTTNSINDNIVIDTRV